MSDSSSVGAPADLLLSPLNDRHVILGAKFAEFGGWSMPLEYSGVVTEHHAVRNGVGIFDVSHLGKAVIAGPGTRAFANSCLSNDLDKIEPGKAQYTLCLDEATGGVVDDLIAYLRSDDEVFLIPNAANTTEVVRRLAAAAPEGVEVTNVHRDYAVLAVQGPKSDETLSAIGFPVGHGYMSFVEVEQGGVPAVVCRTGYTGERGYELVVPNSAAAAVWDAIMAAGGEHGIVAAGLGARDTLRTEMGYPLHGQDISLDISPLEGRVGWALGWKKPGFWGREILAEQKATGPSRLLRGLLASGRGIPRPHMGVFSGDEIRLGEVTSGTFSPSLKKGIALALLDAGLADGDEVYVDIRGRREPFVVTKPPFLTPGVRES